MKSMIAFVAVLIFGLAVAHAQTPRKNQTVDACLAASKANPKFKPNTDICIGVTSNPCIGPDEGAKRDSDVIACLDDERKQWDMVLNAAFQALKKSLEPEQQTKLTEMQRAWIASRDLTCQFYMDYFDGSMANPMIVNCLNRETARRAIFLKGFATTLAASC